ncbi:hypothetical protein [Trinickia violacea]|uniref:hypothetical protein n=1 Tax=Trinickia violacea TaxID=2571746 RepID=UPI0020C81A82|nr:hypothetical protein [Trinickia violacea]
MEQRGQGVAALWQAIDELDFDRMKQKMLHGQRSTWTAEALAHAEEGYRRFLKLAAKYPQMPVVPSEAVDDFWHAHILDTQRYAADCERIFGGVLHHNPYVGIDGPEDEARLLSMAEETNKLMASEFRADEAEAGAYCAKPVVEAAAYCAVSASGKAAYCAVSASGEAAYCAVSASSDAAYCAVSTSSKAAYCAVSAAGKPAYCAVSASSDAAYCAVSASSKPAYCAVSASSKAAYCAVSAAGKPAYCAVSASSEAAYCAVSASSKPAYCAVSASSEAAYCAVSASGKPAYCAVADAPAYCAVQIVATTTIEPAALRALNA